MATIQFKGQALKTVGDLPKVGQTIPQFHLTKADLSEANNQSFTGKKVIFNIFPSIDTPTCAMSVRKFNEQAAQLKNTVVLCVSADLPFAQKRFCGAEGINNVLTASSFRHPEFGKNFGVTIAEGPLAGLLSRAVIVCDEHGKVLHAEQVAELSQEPNYGEALQAAK
jgi:thiol peroxidase